MSYEKTDFETTEIVGDKKEHHKTCEDTTRILIAGVRRPLRQRLIELVNQEADLGVSVETEDAHQALDVIRKQQVDLAIVDISLKDTNGIQLAERIKLQSPNLPVLKLKMHDEALFAKRGTRAGAQEYVISNEATEQIIKAVRYIQSLLRSQIFGFTILVKTA